MQPQGLTKELPDRDALRGAEIGSCVNLWASRKQSCNVGQPAEKLHLKYSWHLPISHDELAYQVIIKASSIARDPTTLDTH